MRWLCVLFHKWTVWGVPYDNRNYSTQFQRRTCERCGKVHERIL